MKKKKKEKFQVFRSQEHGPYKTIKTTLKSVLRDQGIQPHIENLVQEINDLVIHTYQFIRLYLLYLYEKELDFPEINEAWIMACIKTLGTRDNRGAKSMDVKLLETLDNFYTKEYRPLLGHQKTDLRNKTFLLPYIATKIYTGLVVNIQERFVQHLLRFINTTTSKITQDKSILHGFKKQFLNIEDTDARFNDWMDKHEDNILPQNISKSVQYDVKVRPLEYLKGLLYMNSVLEKTVLENGDMPKLFQPLPLRTNLIAKNLVIDSASLVNLFCPQDCKKGDLLRNITENQELIWSSMLRTKSKIFKNKHYIFHNQIQTDGFSCSLLFIRKDLVGKKWGSKVPQAEEQEFHNIEDLNKEQLTELKDRNIVGCDPGKRSLVYKIDSQGNKLQYTSPQKMCESKSKRNKRVLQKEKKKHGITLLETELTEHSAKTVDYQKFKEYLVLKNKLNQQTHEFYQKLTWRKMAMRTYAYSQKSVDKFLNKISQVYGSEKDVVIGYGNWSRSTQMKYYEPTIGKGLRKLIHRRYDTLTINEHCTTKKCCECHQDLVHHRDANKKEIFRLLKCNDCVKNTKNCPSSDCVSADHKNIVFRTRDVNSAVNIREITSLWISEQRRLPVFSRSFTEESSFTTCLQKEVEKVGQSKVPDLSQDRKPIDFTGFKSKPLLQNALTPVGVLNI